MIHEELTRPNKKLDPQVLENARIGLRRFHPLWVASCHGNYPVHPVHFVSKYSFNRMNKINRCAGTNRQERSW